MKIFFDTEFTGLHKNTTLISIGLIDENGRTFYAEFSDYDEAQCDDWINENVIKHLKFANAPYPAPITNLISANEWEVYGDKPYVKEVLYDWLSKYESIELVSDVSHYDMVLFIDIWGGAFDIPSTVNPACHDINQDIARYYEISETEAFDYSREQILQNNAIVIDGDKHNSLYDAKVIKTIYEIIKSHGLL
jgi:hypothetical protein